MNYDKNKRYRQKQMEEGKCPHCGKDCEPGFKQCRNRIIDKAMGRVMRQLSDKGIAGVQFINCSFEKGEHNDNWYEKMGALFDYVDYDADCIKESIEVRVFIARLK